MESSSLTFDEAFTFEVALRVSGGFLCVPPAICSPRQNVYTMCSLGSLKEIVSFLISLFSFRHYAFIISSLCFSVVCQVSKKLQPKNKLNPRQKYLKLKKMDLCYWEAAGQYNLMRSSDWKRSFEGVEPL